MAAEATASTLVSQDNALRLARAQHRYGYDTGTGYAACDVALMTSEESDSYASEVKVRQAFRAADQRWLNGGGDAGERMGISLDQRRTFYCSPSEQETGWCRGAQPGGFGAGDSDASAWLLNRDYGAEEVMTAADYIDVVAPLPTVKPNPSTAEQDAAFVRVVQPRQQFHQGGFAGACRTDDRHALAGAGHRSSSTGGAATLAALRPEPQPILRPAATPLPLRAGVPPPTPGRSTSGNWATAWCGYCSATTRSTSRSWVWARAASGSRWTTWTRTSGCRRASRSRARGSRAEAAVWKMARRTRPAGSSWVLCSAVTARSISCRIRSVCSIRVLACGVSTRARPYRCTRGTPHSRARADSCWETAEGV